MPNDDITGDPRLRRLINSYLVNIRDEVKRQYFAKGPCQPHNKKFLQSGFSGNMEGLIRHSLSDTIG